MLNRQFKYCLKRLSSSYTFEDFQKTLPIVIVGEARQNAFESLKMEDDDPWYEKLLGPYRNMLTNYASTSWVNSRFSTSTSDPPYLPDEFLEGAKKAALMYYMKFPCLTGSRPKMRQVLQDSFSTMTDRQLGVVFKDPKISNMKVKEVWICFGDKEESSSTLNFAPIHTTVTANPPIFWRYNGMAKKWYYSEMNFEYCIKPDAEDFSNDLPDPTLAERTAATKGGAVLAIEVDFDLKMEADIYIENEILKSYYIDRKAVMRFETSHFTGKCNSKWKVADVDNYFASQLLKETLSKEPRN